MRRQKIYAAMTLSVIGLTLATSIYAHGTKLHELMEEIGRQAKILAQLLRDETQNQEPLLAAYEAARKMEGLFLEAYGEEPHKAHLIPVGKERELFLISYREHIARAMTKVLEIEAALKEENREKAIAFFKELLVLQKEAHDKFRLDEDD